MSKQHPTRKVAPPRPAARDHLTQRKPVRRTPAWAVPAATVGGLALLVAAFLAIRYISTAPPLPAPGPDATAVVLSAITSLPASEFDQVAMGSADQSRLKAVSGAALTGATGKPLVLYFGAEFCPYCAGERWPLIIALSRFGTFSGLQTTTSSSSDVFPNTPTFTFHHATYSSQLIEFQSVESSDRNGTPLENPSPAQLAVIHKYDPGGSIPFIDLGNRYAAVGATSTDLPNVLTGLSWQSIADALRSSTSPQAKSILGSANLLTAAICKLTADQPAAVCSGSAIQAIEPRLGG